MNRRADFVLIVNQPFERSQTFVDYFTLASLIVFRVLSNCSAIGRIRNRSDLFLESKHREPSRVFSVERPSMFVKYSQAAFCRFCIENFERRSELIQNSEKNGKCRCKFTLLCVYINLKLFQFSFSLNLFLFFYTLYVRAINLNKYNTNNLI